MSLDVFKQAEFWEVESFYKKNDPIGLVAKQSNSTYVMIQEQRDYSGMHTRKIIEFGGDFDKLEQTARQENLPARRYRLLVFHELLRHVKDKEGNELTIQLIAPIVKYMNTYLKLYDRYQHNRDVITS